MKKILFQGDSITDVCRSRTNPNGADGMGCGYPLLVKARLLTGLRGKGGGYRLTLAPEQYTVGDILRLTEESLAPVSCIERGVDSCPRAAECRTLSMWQGLAGVINEYLDNITIADLMQPGAAGDYYVI